MAIDPLLILRTGLAVLIFFALPGWALTRVLWPPGVEDGPTRLERGYLSVALSAALTICVGAVLGFLPHGERGFFRVPLVVALLIALTAGFLWLGRQRETGNASTGPARSRAPARAAGPPRTP